MGVNTINLWTDHVTARDCQEVPGSVGNRTDRDGGGEGEIHTVEVGQWWRGRVGDGEGGEEEGGEEG